MTESINIELHPLGYEHAPALRAALIDGRVARFLSSKPYPFPEDEEVTQIERLRNMAQGYPHAVLCDRQFIGTAGFYIRDGHRAEAGFWLAPDYWGRCIGATMLGQLLDIAREKGVHVMEADIFEDNTASRRLVEKLGFVPVGEEYASSRGRGKDEKILTLLYERVLS